MSAMHIPVLRGRDLNEGDIAGKPGAILISKSMAEKFWPGEDAVGKRLTMTFFPRTIREVVGIVGDVKLDSLDQTRPTVSLYMPLGQITADSDGVWRSFSMTLVVRTEANSAGLATAISNAVHQVVPDILVRNILTMDDVVTASLTQQRFNTLLLGTFAVVALILAAIGIYSVLSYNVKRRVSEIGIRLAFGARVPDVLRMVIVDAMKPTLLGLAIGVGVALAFGRVMSSLIYEVKPGDPITFAVVALLLAGVALLASALPAYRAAKTDPNSALRYE
jgi:putative ABC transport system permease protein